MNRILVSTLCIAAAHGTLIAAPVITGLEPGNSPSGGFLTINGSGFGNDPMLATVTFMGPATVQAGVMEISDSQIRTVVPIAPIGNFQVAVQIGAEISNGVGMDIVPSAIPDAMQVLQQIVDDLRTVMGSLPSEVTGGSSLCTPSQPTAVENLEACINSLGTIPPGTQVPPGDIFATNSILIDQLEAALPVMTSEQTSFIAEMVSSSEMAARLSDLAALSMQRGTSRCGFGQLADAVEAASSAISLGSAASGPFLPMPADAIMTAVDLGGTILACLLNVIPADLLSLEISPASVTLTAPNCVQDFALTGHYTNNPDGGPMFCSLIWSFRGFGFGAMIIPLPTLTVDEAVDTEAASWTVGANVTLLGAGAFGSGGPPIQGENTTTTMLSGLIICKTRLVNVSADVSVGPEVFCNGVDEDCDGIADEGQANCDDNNLCTIDICNPATGSCLHVPISCKETPEPCTTEMCFPATGCIVVNIAAGAACNDGLNCTDNDQCDGMGNCVGTPKDCSHLSGPCAQGSCREADGECIATPISCDGDDQDPCTEDFFPCDPVFGCHREITECVGGDGCCPPGCTPLLDSDCPACPCPGDFDSSGSIDHFEIAIFVNCFFGNVPPFNCDCADANEDGAINGLDIPTFVESIFNSQEPCKPD